MAVDQFARMLAMEALNNRQKTYTKPEIDEKLDGKASAVDVDQKFTKEEKQKLASITNPIQIMGKAESVSALYEIENPKSGWLYFVGSETESEFEEYVYTQDGVWELVGHSKVELRDYITQTDFESLQETINEDAAHMIEINNKVDENFSAISANKNELDKLMKSVNTLTNGANGLKILTGNVVINRAAGLNSVKVNYPDGSFSSRPVVSVTPRTGAPQQYPTAISLSSDTGFTLWVYNNGEPTDLTMSVDYIAIGQ